MGTYSLNITFLWSEFGWLSRGETLFHFFSCRITHPLVRSSKITCDKDDGCIRLVCRQIHLCRARISSHLDFCQSLFMTKLWKPVLNLFVLAFHDRHDLINQISAHRLLITLLLIRFKYSISFKVTANISQPWHKSHFGRTGWLSVQVSTWCCIGVFFF